jgi:hypothetical protein
MLVLIAGTVSCLHMHLLVELHGQPSRGGKEDRGRRQEKLPNSQGDIVAADFQGHTQRAVGYSGGGNA